jgi:hypothetical protein
MDLIDQQKKLVKDIKPSVTNKEYQKLSYQISIVRKRMEVEKGRTQPTSYLPELSKSLKSLLKKRLRLASTSPNPKYIDFEYVRYADD